MEKKVCNSYGPGSGHRLSTGLKRIIKRKGHYPSLNWSQPLNEWLPASVA